LPRVWITNTLGIALACNRATGKLQDRKGASMRRSPEEYPLLAGRSCSWRGRSSREGAHLERVPTMWGFVKLQGGAVKTRRTREPNGL